MVRFSFRSFVYHISPSFSRTANDFLWLPRGAVLLINKKCCIIMVPVFSIFYLLDSFLLFFLVRAPIPLKARPAYNKARRLKGPRATGGGAARACASMRWARAPRRWRARGAERRPHPPAASVRSIGWFESFGAKFYRFFTRLIIFCCFL